VADAIDIAMAWFDMMLPARAGPAYAAQTATLDNSTVKAMGYLL
jgi:hypothetical protein